MTSAYDLSLAPDSRFGKFRQHYTTEEHLMSIYEGVRGNAAISVGFEAILRGLDEIGAYSDVNLNALWQRVNEDLQAFMAELERVFEAQEPKDSEPSP